MIYSPFRSHSKISYENSALSGGPPVNIRCVYLRAALFCAIVSATFMFWQSPCARAQGQDRAPEYYQADIEYGAQIFATQCTPCHGTNGDQIPGVNFRAGQFKRVVTDNDLRATITNGVPGTAMQPFAFGASELTGIVSYLRNMGSFDTKGLLVGNAGRGRELF